MLIGIAGKKQNGKTTVANMIYDDFLTYERKAIIYPFARPLKECVNFILGHYVHADIKKTLTNQLGLINSDGHVYTNRELLQLVGTKLREIDPDIWIKSLDYKFSDYHDDLIIDDVRFPNEVDYIKSKGGILIRVNRPAIESNDNHISETALDDYHDWDHIITNDGSIIDLITKVRQLSL